jgi:hypothetical protein
MAEWEAMLVLDEVIQITADQLRCRIIREGVPLQFTVRFAQFDEGIRGMNLEGISPRESWELSNRDEFRALLKTLWAHLDGAPVILPKEIHSDWTMPGASEG